MVGELKSCEWQGTSATRTCKSGVVAIWGGWLTAWARNSQISQACESVTQPPVVNDGLAWSWSAWSWLAWACSVQTTRHRS